MSNRGQDGVHGKMGRKQGAGEALGLQEGARNSIAKTTQEVGEGGWAAEESVHSYPPKPSHL